MYLCVLCVGVLSLNSSLSVYPCLSPSRPFECESLVVRGKWSLHTGHMVDRRQLLYLEEMLYLMKEGVMEVMDEEIPMSIAEGYALLNESPSQEAIDTQRPEHSLSRSLEPLDSCSLLYVLFVLCLFVSVEWFGSSSECVSCVRVTSFEWFHLTTSDTLSSPVSTTENKTTTTATTAASFEEA